MTTPIKEPNTAMSLHDVFSGNVPEGTTVEFTYSSESCEQGAVPNQSYESTESCDWYPHTKY